MSNLGQVSLDPYLFFKGTAKEALEFYKEIFGGQLDISTYDSVPQDSIPEDSRMDEKAVMHGLLSGGYVRIMASDSNNASPEAKKIELSLSGENEAVLRGFWDGLAKDGKATMPLEKAPWGDIFGMVTDKYNISWLVNITPAKRA